MQIILISLLFIVFTVLIYLTMNFLYFKYHRPFLLPVMTSTLLIILILLLFTVPYETYMIGGKWIDLLLGPAIVSLAIPLYKQRDIINRNVVAITVGVFTGVAVGMVSGLVFAKMSGFSQELILTLLPKSITAPVAIQIAAELGGISSLAVIFVMIAGFTGPIFGPYVLKWIKVDTAIGRGIGLGAASHALGTAKAIEYGEQEASMSSVAMTLCAIVGSIIGPGVVWLFY